MFVEVCDIIQGKVAGMEWVEGKWGRLWCRLGRRCGCRCCTYRLGKGCCGLCTGWSRGGQKGKLNWWIVTVPEEGMHARVTGSGVRGLLFLLPQLCVTGWRSKCEGELIISERNVQVRGQL